MKRHLHILLVLLFFFHSYEGSATIYRVNADPASMAQYSDVQSAIDAAATLDGDSIYIEGFAGTGVFGVSTTYFTVFLYKPLHLFGPGYFLEENEVYADGYMLPFIQQLFIDFPAQGGTVNGLTIQNVQLNANFFALRKNKMSSLSMNSVFGCSVTENYFQAFPFLPAISCSNSFNNVFSNNFIGSSSLSDNGEPLIQIFGGGSNLLDHNTLVGGSANLEQCTVSNNIFDQLQIESTFSTNFFNNIFWFGLAFDPGDVPGTGNFFFVDITTVFVGGSTGDAQWQTLATSVATGNAQDGTDIGMFGGFLPYKLSGLELPVISLSSPMVITYLEMPILVTFNYSSPTLSNISQGEYMVHVPGVNEAGFGFGTPFTIAPGTNGSQTIVVSTAFLPVGNYGLGYRIREDDGTWSHTREHDFEIQEDPPPVDDLPNITGVEYFLGTDASFGNAPQEPNLLDTPEATFTFTIPLSGFAPGPQSISFRAFDSHGNYGTTVSKSILVIEGDGSNDLPNLSNIEFFADGDPGFDGAAFGPGIGETDETYLFTAFFTTPGIHQLQVRSKDVTGRWGTTQGKTILILPDEEPTPNLQKVEYFIDNDPDYDNGTPFFTAPATTATQTVTIPLTGVPYGEHELFSRAKDVSGDYGTIQRELFFTFVLPGDFTGDGCVNVSDLLVFMGGYGCSSPLESYCMTDLNNDPTVNVTDLLLFMSYYATGNCGSDGVGLSE